MNLTAILIGPLLLFLWLIVNTVYAFKQAQNKIIDANQSTKLIVKCEKCLNEHNASIQDFFSTTISRSKRITASASAGVFGVTGTHYAYYAKKFHCPICNRKTWSEVKNYHDLTMHHTDLILPVVVAYFVRLLAGGFIIKLLVDIII